MNPDVAIQTTNLERVFLRLIRDVPFFEVLNKDVLPYGLKQHTRSICWLAEQVILQNVKKRQTEYNVAAYEDPDSDISAWDACLTFPGQASPCYINIKVSDVTRPVRRNDIASVQKLLNFYAENPGADLFYVVIMLEFDENKIHFRKLPVVRYYPWIGDFVVNSRNHHIQAVYENTVEERSTDDFISLVKQKALRKNVL
jgi:hypothetical protein